MKENRLDVTVDNLPVKALVDSRDSSSVVSEKLCHHLKKVMFPLHNSTVFKVANGSYVLPKGKCTLQIGISGRIHPFEFVVLPEFSCDVILGWNFLQASGALIDCGRSQLTLDDAEAAPEKEFAKPLRLCSMTDYEIPAYSIMKISVQNPGSEDTVDMIINGSKPLAYKKEIFLPATLVTLSRGKTEIWVVNGQSTAKVIPQGMCVAHAEPFYPDSIAVISEASSSVTKFAESKQSTEFSQMIASDLNNDQERRLLAVLQEYSGAFKKRKEIESPRVTVKHRINTGDHPPLSQRAYRVSPTERRAIHDEVEKMLESRIIRPSESPWSSPVVLVRKKDNSWRFCVDYRRLNKVTKKDVYPLPRIDDILDCMQGSKFFSSMDLSSGYWQIEVNEPDREKTAFITPEGLYEFNVMPFGLCNAPATFERMMDNLLRHLKWTMCLCYLDDIIITILGHVVSEDGIKPDPEKVRAVKNFPVPKNVHDVRSFLGLCSYYRRFIKNFCYRAQPLQELLKGDSKFAWGLDQTKSFENLKTALISDPILGLFDDEAPTEMHTDASGYGLGAVLVQIQKEKERVIAYASKTLTKAEKNYSTTERECLAAVWAITKFRPYLYGRFFKIVTDHHSLCWLTGLKDPAGKLARWALRLQQYNFEITYKSGKKHKDADSLSRNPLEDKAVASEKVDALAAFSDIAVEQRKDPELSKMIDAHRNAEPVAKNFHLIDGVLCKKNFDPSGKKWLTIIPRHIRLEILQHFHDAPTAGHLECQRRKSVPQKPPGLLTPIPPATVPFQRVGIDLLGRFPKSTRGNKWIIVCTDYLSRFAVTKALPTAEAQEVAQFMMEEIVLKHGAPRVIITDRGKVFQSKLVTEINRLCNSRHKMTTGYHPQTNGLTERFNKTLADMLSMYVGVEQKNWDDILPFVTFAYNTAKQETTGFTPFYLLHGREAETTLDTLFPYSIHDSENEYVRRLVTQAEESRQLARIRTLEAQQRDKDRYNSKHRDVSYNPGDLVWVFTPVRKVGLSEKLLKRYFGPYRVV
ncbi:Transposon Ty3-I Gag-Pol polyprotein [Araneus ventricosus]|uniref:RNA-directed DNA polymerase n=1 Tax=Araneus ventricosus TaxID=182803 RepID=A0A4Y2MK48_ARAVE|nr:Transposon Ty3-I Gag-Pol polyprotein [Araneus ventricosus]